MRNTPVFTLQLLNRLFHFRHIFDGLARSYTHTHTQIFSLLHHKRSDTADVPFHDKVPGQSNHRKYSQDRSSQHNNKT